MARITESDLRNRIERLNSLCGLPLEPYSPKDDGNGFEPNADVYHLDIAYGGYRLAQMSNQPGCTGTSDVSPRLTKRELYDWINAYIRGIEIGKQQS